MSEKRKGEWYMLAEVILWGLFPVVTVLTYQTLPALVSLAWSTVFAALFFLVVIAFGNKWKELVNPAMWRYVLLATFFLGVVFYGLYFSALEYTTAGNAALIVLLGVFTSFLFFNVARKETFSRSYAFGSVLMVLGAGIVLAPNVHQLNLGDLLLVLGICITPFGNFYSQKAVTVASSETVMFLRSAISMPFLFLLAYLMGKEAVWTDVGTVLPFLLVNGILLLGLSKLFFLESIRRLPVTKAVSLESGAVLVTLAAAWLFLGQTPTLLQLLAIVPLLAGVMLLTDQWRLGTRPLP